jgi:hypothetical protein
MEQNVKPHVFWDDQEWEDFATLLHEDNPTVRYLQSPDLATLTTRDLNNAAAQMRRPRHFVALGAPRKKLLEAFARLREQANPGPGADARFHRAPPPAEPPSPLKLDDKGRPIAPPAGQAAKDESAPEPFAALTWDRNEWLAIATEIDRTYPQSNYPENDKLPGLTSNDVAFAQRILPVARQIRHIKVASFSTLRPALQDAFREIKRNRAACEVEQAVLAKAEDDARRALSKAASPAQGAAVQGAPAPAPAPEPMPLPAPLPLAVAPAPPALPLVEPAPAARNPWEAAFAPLVDQMIGMLTARLAPMIAEMIDRALLAPPAPDEAPRVAAPVAPAVALRAAPAQPGAAPAAAKAAPERRLRLGLVGGRKGNIVSTLAHDFPTVEFRWIDSKKEADSVKNCDRVILMTRFCSHPLRDQVRKLITAEQYTPVNGALSDIRRVVTGLLNDRQAVPQAGVAALAA